MTRDEINYHKFLNLLVVIKNSISMISFIILAVILKKWWLSFGAIIFTSYIGKSEEKTSDKLNTRYIKAKARQHNKNISDVEIIINLEKEIEQYRNKIDKMLENQNYSNMGYRPKGPETSEGIRRPNSTSAVYHSDI